MPAKGVYVKDFAKILWVKLSKSNGKYIKPYIKKIKKLFLTTSLYGF